MKKLLSLLPIVTITGSSMITVIAVNSFEHLEIIEKKNNREYNINYENVKESTSFVEKIYDYNKSNWNLSIVLSKEKLLEIIKLFVKNNQNDFIAKTKQVIMEIKKHSINFSAEAFDENAIDAYVHIFWKNFTEICNLFADLGMAQQIKTMLFIEKGQWIKNDNLFQIIGEKSKWEQNDNPIDLYSKEKYNNIINYAEKLFINETYKNIEVKHQNNDFLFIFKNNFWKKIIKVLVEKFETDITQFEKWFIKEVKTNVDNSNYFSNRIIPLDENLKKIADYLFKNINNYNIFLQAENKEILIILNNKNEVSFVNYSQQIKNSFVEKIYDYNKSNWNLSIVLSKEKLLEIIKLFVQSNKNDFIAKTKQVIMEIKKHSINFSAEAFDENAIDAYAHIFWKNFSHYYNLFLHLDSNQLFIIILYIDGGEYIKDEKIARIIGTNNDLNMEQIEQDQLITNLINKNAQKYYKLNNDIVEKSTFSKLKIKINKITWSRIIIIFFSTKDKENFIEEIKNLFITFSPSYNDNNYKLNEEELKSFAYIIWNHFSYYYDLFWNLKIDESIRIISFTNIPKGYWYESNPNLYNHIVNKNNDIVDWETFNNRKIENKQESLYYYDEFKRRKRTNNKLQNNQSYLYNVPSNGNCLFWSVVMAFLLPVRNDNEAFRTRFIQLFGEENLNHLSYVQNLFSQFKLTNHGSGHNLYNNRITIHLVETVFRNRVVDYINSNLYRFRGENRATFSSAILAEVRVLGLDNLSEEQLIENYLNNMRLIGTWAGSIEIEAITNMLNINIMRNNELFYSENQNQNEINHIYIYYINHNHYNFVLTRETNQEENKMDIDEPEQVSAPIPFSSVITNTYLGQLSDNTPEIIINRISQLNPRFDLNQIYVTDIQENNAVVLPFVPPLWKGKIPTVVHFSLFQDRKKQPIIQYKNVHQDDWKTKEIDLKKTTMPTPINSQIHSSFCTLAVLENLLINNIAKNPNVSLSQSELFNHFLEKYKINDITKNGLNLYAIYKFLKDDPEVSKSLVGRYSYFDFHNFFFHNLFNDKKIRMILFQMLVWTSLYFSTPVIMGTFNSKGMGHCISISGIRPNEDPFKTEYIIRDPNIWENNIRIGQELSINGNDLYSSLFNKEGIFGALLISTYVFGSIFIPSFINMMRENMPFFQSALGTIDRIPTPLISEDSIATEDDILNSNYLFDNELLNILFKNFM